MLDVKARGTHGQLFHVEIQLANEGDYHKRALYCWAKLYTEQLKSGENYDKLSKAIGIHLLNFNAITSDARYHHRFHTEEKKSSE